MAKRSSMEGSEEEEHGDHPGGFQRVGKVAAGAGRQGRGLLKLLHMIQENH